MNEITIPMEEYKELLIVKGKYEELKSQQKPTISSTLLTRQAEEVKVKGRGIEITDD